MPKLIDILINKLESYPEDGCIVITQDEDTNCFYWRQRPEFYGVEWVAPFEDGERNTSRYLCCTTWYDEREGEYELASDYQTAMVTREMFDDAKQRRDNPSDVLGWRDRILAINEQIETLGKERYALTTKLKDENLMLVHN